MSFKTDKFPRIMHFPFSGGATNDDRIVDSGWYDFIKDKQIIYLEKLDGENVCFKQDAIYARTHAVPNKNPWASHLWPIHNSIKSELGDLEIFGENMFAVHSIEYDRLTSYFYTFAVRQKDVWLSWDEVKFISEYFGFNVVPEISVELIAKNESEFECLIKSLAKHSNFGDTCEGIVVRVRNCFNDIGDSTFGYNALKYVRKNHVKTTEHWTKNWRKAKLTSL